MVCDKNKPAKAAFDYASHKQALKCALVKTDKQTKPLALPSKYCCWLNIGREVRHLKLAAH